MACDTDLDKHTRLGACSIALPYLFPRLSATTVQANHTVVRVDPQELMDRIADRIARQNAQVTIEAEPADQPSEAAE